MGRPDPGPLVKYFGKVLMIERLIFLAVVLAGRIGAVVGDNALAAVLGNAQTDFRVNLVEIIQPGAVILHLAAVPAEVVVVALHIRNSVHGAVDGGHGHMGDGGETGIVKLFAKSI